MMGLHLSGLSLGLLAAAAVAFTRQRRAVMVACGGLFVPVAVVATVAVWWPLSPAVAVALLALGMGLPLVGLALFAADWLLAAFALEMTYATVLAWLIWPLLVGANFVGLALRL